MDSDETYKRFVVKPPPDAWVVKLSYRDNPWVPAVLEKPFSVRDRIAAGEPLIAGLPLAAYGLPMPPPRVPTIRGRKGKGGKGGRAPFEPSEEQRAAVYHYACVGVPQDIIATLMGFSQDTLFKYFETELHTAGPAATANIAGTLYQKAMRGDTASAIFWMKTRGGWRETNRTELTGPDGRPIQTQSQVVHLDTSALDVEARDALQQALLAARGDIIDTDATDVE
jgi:hypothetical protein